MLLFFFTRLSDPTQVTPRKSPRVLPHLIFYPSNKPRRVTRKLFKVLDSLIFLLTHLYHLCIKEEENISIYRFRFLGRQDNPSIIWIPFLPRIFLLSLSFSFSTLDYFWQQTQHGCTSRHCRELLLVYEYIPNGTVADHLHAGKGKEAPLPWPVRMGIAVETASALAYLHKSDIIHRDVKTNNILLDNNFSVKVADFGLSRLFPNDVSHISTAPQGTPGYVDPEYHQCYQLTDKSDVYSFGVVLIELISSMPAVDISRHRHEVNLANLAISRIQRCAFNELIDPSLGFDSDPEVTRMTTSVAKLAFRCLQLEKDLRPSMDEVLTFLKEIRGDDEFEIEKKIVNNEMDTNGILSVQEV